MYMYTFISSIHSSLSPHPLDHKPAAVMTIGGGGQLSLYPLIPPYPALQSSDSSWALRASEFSWCCVVWVCGPPAIGEAANREAEGESNSVYIDSVFDAGTVPSVSVEFDSTTSILHICRTGRSMHITLYSLLCSLPVLTYLHYVQLLTFSLKVFFTFSIVIRVLTLSCMVTYTCVHLSMHIFIHLNILLQ